jgi:hypothetical protein
MPAAYFVVRATVSDPAKRAAFDRWYSKEHLPDAVKSFGRKSLAVLEPQRSRAASGDLSILRHGRAGPGDEWQ